MWMWMWFGTQLVSENGVCRQALLEGGILAEVFENNVAQGSKEATKLICRFIEGNEEATQQLNDLILDKVR